MVLLPNVFEKLSILITTVPLLRSWLRFLLTPEDSQIGLAICRSWIQQCVNRLMKAFLGPKYFFEIFEMSSDFI